MGKRRNKGHQVRPAQQEDEETFDTSENQEEKEGFKGTSNKIITRKALRKNLRLMKKLKKQEHNMRKQKKPTIVTTPSKPEEKAKSIKQETSTKQVKKPKSPAKIKSSAQKRENIEKEQKQQRVKQLRIANKLEEKNIKKIEKQLKLNKRKSKNLPKSFVDDGLDFLLDICDPEKRSAVAKEEIDFADNDVGFEEDLALLKSDNSDQEKSEDGSMAGSDEESEGSDQEGLEEEEASDGSSQQSDEDESMQQDMEEGDMEEDEESEMSENGDAESLTEETPPQKEEYREDIYGRLRDKKGNVVSGQMAEVQTGKYVPPGKRLANATGTDPEMLKLKRQLKGLFNRLAETNLPGIVSSIEQLYLSHSRHNMQEVINSLVVESLVGRVLNPERLIMEHCLLIAALHANVGTEVGAQFLECIVRKFDSLFDSADVCLESKELDNLLLIVSHLYNFGLVAAPLLTDILQKLSQRFSEKDIELILIVLRSVGFSLRKDDPVGLKDIILSLQTKAGQAADQPNRIRFMLDILLAIRNNNMTKIPNYDPEVSEHLRKVLRNLVRKGMSVSKMNISYGELMAAERRGRWWVVGSAWVGQGPAAPAAEPTESSSTNLKEEQKFSAELLEMARKQRMNTDVRRNIFCILMTAEDFMEAVERLMRLGLKAQQERELLLVALDCSLHEKKYNPYYSHVIQKFCHLHRRFQIATQFALWDRFKELSSLSQTQLTHLAKIVVHLLTEGALNLTILKVIEFTEMDRLLVKFLRQILLGLLMHTSETAVQTLFIRLGQSKSTLLKEGLSLFIHHFLMKNTEKMDDATAEKLKQRVKMAEQALAVGVS